MNFNPDINKQAQEIIYSSETGAHSAQRHTRNNRSYKRDI